MSKILYAIIQGNIYELDYTLDNNKYRLLPDNILNKRVIIDSQLDTIHGKKFNAYVVSFDLDKAIDMYVKYIERCIDSAKYELDVLKQYREVQ